MMPKPDYQKPQAIFTIDSFANRQELASWMLDKGKETLLWAVSDALERRVNPVTGIFRIEGWFGESQQKVFLTIGYQLVIHEDRYFLAINNNSFLPFKLKLDNVVGILANALGTLVESRCQISNPWPRIEESLIGAEAVATIPIVVTD